MQVYLINQHGTNNFKIGLSKDPEKRLKELQTANGDSLDLIHTFNTRYAFKLESALHRVYASKKTIGEWFQLELKDVNSFLEECVKRETILNILFEQNTYLQDKK
jgi:hypothetical protein